MRYLIEVIRLLPAKYHEHPLPDDIRSKIKWNESKGYPASETAEEIQRLWKIEGSK